MMSRWGVGPIFAFISIGYTILVLFITRYFYPIFQIRIIPYYILAVIGIILIIIGIPFFIIAIMQVTRAYNANKLVTDGVFRCCRHPLYASWVVFIVPGIVLLANSWIGLTVPLFMYLILNVLVKKEEVYLEEVFGSEYSDYKQRIPSILPFGCLKRPK